MLIMPKKIEKKVVDSTFELATHPATENLGTLESNEG